MAAIVFGCVGVGALTAVGVLYWYAVWSASRCCYACKGTEGELWVCEHKVARRYREGRWRRLSEDQYAVLAMAQLTRDLKEQRGGVL